MRVVTWAIRLVVFLLLVAFAAKNAEPVTLRFYFDLALEAPLVVVLFGFFAASATRNRKTTRRTAQMRMRMAPGPRRRRARR